MIKIGEWTSLSAMQQALSALIYPGGDTAVAKHTGISPSHKNQQILFIFIVLKNLSSNSPA